MENLNLQHTEDTPEVILNSFDGSCFIEGRSLPENAVAFYLPIIEWLNTYNNEISAAINFEFKLDYFNTASAKQITKVMLTLQKIAQSNAVKIRWHYLTEDADIKSSGMRFAKLIKADIELVAYDDN
ncbi:MAG: DUF1987 domain-containing protein [Salinivirgaceae bacterium]|nr:DUF1987 domain-containing protein [Salinivirgaceae bacterium]